MLVNNKYHITYCTNIHPGNDWAHTFSSLKTFVPGIKNAVSAQESFGLGLRLSNKASEELAQPGNMANFKNWLEENKVYVFTMNGFPYGNFHDERVKDNVHAPDWTTDERVVYTKRLFDQLAELLPEGMVGGISTSPISYKHWHKTEVETKWALEKSAHNYCEIVLQLHEIEQHTGKRLHLDIEPEPDGLLENSDEVIYYFEHFLFPVGTKLLQEKLGSSKQEAENTIKRYLTVCYDICHFSLAYEEPEDSFKKFAAAGIAIGKIQVSAALKIMYDPLNTIGIWNSLTKFDEPTYLHQVTEKIGEKVVTYTDLPDVLERKNNFTELRAHFHVPIFLEKFDLLRSTQDHIIKVVDYLKAHTICDHLEVETYTWDVLPLGLKRDLSESIVREINWLKDKL